MRDKTTAEILDTFGINAQTLAGWIRKGCPCTKAKGRGKQNKFDEGEVASFLKEKGLTGAVGRPGGPLSEDLAAARLRKERAMADLNEIKVAKERGTLVDIAEQERSNIQKFTVIRNKLMGLPSAVAPSITGLDAPEIERILDERIRETLIELSRT